MDNNQFVTWNDFLREEVKQGYYEPLREFLREEYANQICYPKKDSIFRAFKEVEKISNTKVVILGQDPYYNPGLANGLAFSINEGEPMPTSLMNIFEEIHREYGQLINCKGDLSSWAKQGVLLLNTTLTVRSGKAQSHYGQGWEIFTDHVLQLLDTQNTPMVFMLWGKNARRKKFLVTNPNHIVLETSHPSGRSVHLGFSSCNHFRLCNEFLQGKGMLPIDWYSINKSEEIMQNVQPNVIQRATLVPKIQIV